MNGWGNRGDCITSPANAVGSKSLELQSAFFGVLYSLETAVVFSGMILINVCDKVLISTIITTHTGWSKKAGTRPNFCDNFFGKFRPIFIILSPTDSLVNLQYKSLLNIPPHLTNVATLTCEILMSENSDNLKHVQ